jgi:solute carrier family 25 protein 14/30
MSEKLQFSGFSFFYGGLSCMVAALFTHPVDTIKVRLQLHGELAASTKGNAITTMIQREGISSLWKGLSASLLREGSYSTIRMGLYEPLKQALASPHETKEPLYKKIIAGGLAGMVGSGIANPTDLIKVRFQASSESAKVGLWATAKQIVQQEGFVGLYRGVGPTTQRAMILTATQLPIYDHSKRVLMETGYFQEGYTLHFIASMISGFFCATTTSPVDVVKSRYMNQQFQDGKGVMYSSTRDCFVKTIKAEGIAGLYKGWLPNWFRIGPHTVITFLILEQLRRLSGIKPV